MRISLGRVETERGGDETSKTGGKPRYVAPLRKVGIQTKLLVMLFVTSIVSAAVVGFVGHQNGKESLQQAAFDRLTLVRELQVRQLGLSVAALRNSVQSYASGDTVKSALDGFSRGYDALRSTPPPTPAQQATLSDYYTKNFHDRRSETTGEKINVEALVPRTNPQATLQLLYTVPNNAGNQPIVVDPAGDQREWSATAARYAPFFRSVVARQTFTDLLLMNSRGDVVYSALQGADLGSNVVTGTYAGGRLGAVFQDALNSNTDDAVVISDEEYYLPSGGPVAWIVSRVGSKEQRGGVLAARVSLGELERIMTFDRRWEENGLGRTGETFIVGSDHLMRSNSRRLIENKDEYRAEVAAAGTDSTVADRAVRLGSTVLVQPAGGAADEALHGRPGTLVGTDYLGHSTLQSYGRVDIPGLQWAVIAKVDVDEAFAPVSQFTRKVVITTVVIIFLVCLLSMFVARVFVQPLRALEGGVERISAGDYRTVLPVTSNDEYGDLTKAFNGMSRSLLVKEELLEEQRRENERLLQSLMPESVAERYLEGEDTIFDEHDDVTVLYAELTGLDDFVTSTDSAAAVDFVNGVVHEIDVVAERFGVEKVGAIHHGYLASCGVATPRIDNVRRTVDFAREMMRIVERTSLTMDAGLQVRIGIATGSATSGLVGRSNLAYDMWGSTVNIAREAQRKWAGPGIYVTDRVRLAVKDGVGFERVGEITVAGTEELIWRLDEDER